MAWQELFGTDVGLLSLLVILITVGMAIYFVRMFVGKMNSEPPAPPIRGIGGAQSPAPPKG